MDDQFADPQTNRCFLAGTTILMADNARKSIEQIRIGDMVMAFDARAEAGRGALVPRRVTRTFQNITRSIVDLRGLKMTPGHVCLSGEGGFDTITAILLRDGTLVDEQGERIRARTGSIADSPDDIPVTVAYSAAGEAAERRALVRAGIPCGLVTEADGSQQVVTLAQMLVRLQARLLPDGTVLAADGSMQDGLRWPAGATPFDSHAQRNWILSTTEGDYTPDWIEALAQDAAAEAQVVNAGPAQALQAQALPGQVGALIGRLPQVGAGLRVIPGLAGR